MPAALKPGAANVIRKPAAEFTEKQEKACWALMEARLEKEEDEAEKRGTCARLGRRVHPTQGAAPPSEALHPHPSENFQEGA